MGIEDAGNYEIYDEDSNKAYPADIDYEYYPEERDAKPSDIILRGTSTTNPERPRTVAAGYDKKTQTMTVVFRGNIWWNYYDVSEEMWQGFITAESKGRYLRDSGLDNWDDMGPANLESLGMIRRSRLNYLAWKSRRHQTKSGGAQNYRRGRGFDLDEGFNQSRGD